MPPSAEVRRAFGGDGAPELLSETSGGVWRVGDVVMKQAAHADEAAFVATISEALPMVATPVADADGAWVHEGWTATVWVDALPDPARWADVLAAGDDLHAALAALEPTWPETLDSRTTPWAVADRVAWGEEPIPVAIAGEALSVVVRALERATDIAPEAAQVIHGDLAGNVLFREAGPPVVVDLSPYRRPAGYARAIAVVDQICWHGAPTSRVELAHPVDVARALVFRVVAAALHSEAAGNAEAERARSLV